MRTAAPTAHPDEEEVHQHGESCGQDGHAAQQNQKTAEGTPSQVLFPRNQIDAINYTQLHKQEFIPVHPLCTKSFVCVREREREGERATVQALSMLLFNFLTHLRGGFFPTLFLTSVDQ